VETVVLNLFGGPGCGKSTTCAGVFAELKLRDVNCEMALEYAKDVVWENTRHLLDNQISVFGEQHRRIHRLLGQVDIIICDSPLLNSILYYKGYNPHFPKMVYEEHRKLRNMNVLLKRQRAFNPAGRVHNEMEAQKLDSDIGRILSYLREDHIYYPADKGAIEPMAAEILNYWRSINNPWPEEPLIPEEPLDLETLKLIQKF